MAVNFRTIMEGLMALNMLGLVLAVRNKEQASSYLSQCVRHYRLLTKKGLPAKCPVKHIFETRATSAGLRDRFQLPPALAGGGGTRVEEITYLAAVTKALKPKVIFEIGTFTGLTTCAFILNAPPRAKVITMDLPPTVEVAGDKNFINTDVQLIQSRQIGKYLKEFGLESRCTQLLSDSLKFDPAPYRGLVELAFIDGAHSLPYVKNDTEKVAQMMTDSGLVFWHDYGGVGRLRSLSDYLEELSVHAPVYSVPMTSLAWTDGKSLKLAATAG